MTGLRTRYMENYQPGLAGVIAAALLADEVPTVLDFAGAVNEERTHTGELVKLLAANRQDAVRTVQRLHRNLGHPETSALVELLASRGASEMVLEVARNYHCAACSRYKKPNSPSPASLQFAKKFNDVVQADVMWIKIRPQKVPILHVVDLASKFEEATVVHSEKTNDLRRALERRWFRIFGAPGELVTDEGRGWASDEMKEFLSDLGIAHTMGLTPDSVQLSAATSCFENPSRFTCTTVDSIARMASRRPCPTSSPRSTHRARLLDFRRHNGSWDTSLDLLAIFSQRT